MKDTRKPETIIRRPQAYLVTFRELVIIADYEHEVREWIDGVARDNYRAQILDVKELRAYGDTYPIGSWDPDRELTCAEIADEMAAKGRTA